jgi:hypothetical protein
MALLRIPERYAAGLIKLRKLPEESLDKLVGALCSTAAPFLHKDLIGSLESSKVEIPRDDFDLILQTVLSLHQVAARMDLPTSEIAEDVCSSMSVSDNEALRIIGEECETFKGRLIKLFNIEALTYLAKAQGVVSDHDRVFLHARTLTDIRAIFGNDPEALPKAASVIHTLNVTYQHGDTTENFYVALDTRDVETLIAVLQRALSKTKGLRLLLQEAKVPPVNVE